MLTNGLLDADKLFQTVKRNNSAVIVDGKNTLNMFYSELDDSEITAICTETAAVINSHTDAYDIREIANTLENLTIFQRTGSASNAYVTTDLALVCIPSMMEIYQKQQESTDGSGDLAWERVIDHEIMHLIRYGANDGDAGNGVEIGFCRMYNTPNGEKVIPVDSLYCP